MLISIRHALKTLLACVALGFGLQCPALAQDLIMGLGSPITSLDPHFANNTPNKAVARHFFEALSQFDEKGDLLPSLATSWKRTSDTIWEFQLRPNVKFYDGASLTADDVVASFGRAPAVPNSPSSLAIFTRSIKQVSAIDPLKVRIETKYPDPLLPTVVTEILIISSARKDADTADYNSGKAMIGTGPFVFESYTPGDRLVMKRNEGYWGKKPEWSKVTMRFMTSDASRVAALLSGDVSIIENVPPDLVQRVKESAFNVVQSRPAQAVYLGLDVGSARTAYVSASDAKSNPLQDKRVRQALSYGIDRKAISERIQQGRTAPAGQLLPDDFFGVSNNVKPYPYDPEKAKALLAEAGYKNGLDLTIHGPSDRWNNDSRVVQAIAQMWNRIGVHAKAEVMPWSVYFPKAGKREFSVYLMANAPISEMASALNALVVTYDPKNGKGVVNRGRYSNPQIDELVNAALLTMDDTKRRDLLAKASELAADEVAVVPLYFYSTLVATSKSIRYAPRFDQFTLAQHVHGTK